MYPQTAKLLAEDRDAGDTFGSAVAVSDDGRTVLIGAEDDEDPNGSIGDVGAGSVYVFARDDTGWNQDTKLIPSDGDPADQFGNSVALSSDGTTALIGAHNDAEPNGTADGSDWLRNGGDIPGGSGSAYLFSRNQSGWEQQTKIAADDGDSVHYFGYSVSLTSNGDTALVGAMNANDSLGAAYLFTRDSGGWSQEATLTANDVDAAGVFASRVEISDKGQTVIVSAPGDTNSNGEDAGSVYVFVSDGGSWREQAKIIPNSGDAGDRFGASVDTVSNGDMITIGAVDDAPTDGGSGSVDRTGSVYVFQRTDGNWGKQAKITANDSASGDQFGGSVAVTGNGDTVIVGASNNDNPGDSSGSQLDNSGAAYVFSRVDGDWTQQVKLVARNPNSNAQLGDQVALSSGGAVTVIGAPAYEGTNATSGGQLSGAGSAYVFGRIDSGQNNGSSGNAAGSSSTNRTAQGGTGNATGTPSETERRQKYNTQSGEQNGTAKEGNSDPLAVLEEFSQNNPLPLTLLGGGIIAGVGAGVYRRYRDIKEHKE
jgi:hypothetical protein